MKNKRFIFKIERPTEGMLLEDSYIINGKTKLSSEHKVRIEYFFNKSRFLCITMDLTECLFSGELIDHTSSVRTDGVWVWSADINHYVLNHEIELPKMFTEYILQNAKKKAPTDNVLRRHDDWWFNILKKDMFEDIIKSLEIFC